MNSKSLLKKAPLKKSVILRLSKDQFSASSNPCPPNQSKGFRLLMAACFLTMVGIFSFSLGIRLPYSFIFPIAVIALTLFTGRYLKPRK
jgi:hypothetical protein